MSNIKESPLKVNLSLEKLVATATVVLYKMLLVLYYVYLFRNKISQSSACADMSWLQTVTICRLFSHHGQVL